MEATLLVLRDPDASNDYVMEPADAVRIIEIDLGRNWSSYNDFASSLRAGDDDALEFEHSLFETASSLPEGSRVRVAIAEFFSEARNG